MVPKQGVSQGPWLADTLRIKLDGLSIEEKTLGEPTWPLARLGGGMSPRATAGLPCPGPLSQATPLSRLGRRRLGIRLRASRPWSPWVSVEPGRQTPARVFNCPAPPHFVQYRIIDVAVELGHNVGEEALCTGSAALVRLQAQRVRFQGTFKVHDMSDTDYAWADLLVASPLHAALHSIAHACLQAVPAQPGARRPYVRPCFRLSFRRPRLGEGQAKVSQPWATQSCVS